jgi:hypothetical protein
MRSTRCLLRRALGLGAVVVSALSGECGTTAAPQGDAAVEAGAADVARDALVAPGDVPSQPVRRMWVTSASPTGGALLSVNVVDGTVTQHRAWGGVWESRGVRVVGGRVVLLGGGNEYESRVEVFARDAWAEPLWSRRVSGRVVDAAYCGGLMWLQEIGPTTPGTRERLVAVTLDGGTEVTTLDLGAAGEEVFNASQRRLVVHGDVAFATVFSAEGTEAVALDCTGRRLTGHRWRMPPGAWLAPDVRPGARLLVVAPLTWDNATERLRDATLSRFDPYGAGLETPFYRSESDLVGVATTASGWTAASVYLYGGRGLSSGSAFRCIDPAGVAQGFGVDTCSVPGPVWMVGDEAWGLLGPCARFDAERFTRIVRWRVGAPCTPLAPIEVDTRAGTWMEPDV